MFLPNPKRPVFANPEGPQFCQSGGVLFLPIRRGPKSIVFGKFFQLERFRSSFLH